MVAICDYAVVDDEPAAHAVLAALMKRHSAFRLVGSYYRADEAESGLGRTPARLLFLDVSMPGATGLDLLERLTLLGSTSLPTTVMTTAHADKALRAYDLGVRDYLLKPIAQDRLDLCIERLMPLMVRPMTSDRLMAFSTGNGHRLCDLGKIFAFEAAGNFAWLITADARILLSEPLKSLEVRLKPFGFIRCHKRYIINRALVTDVATSVLHLVGQFEIPVGDVYRVAIKRDIL